MPFDVQGALAAGYTPDEITRYMASTPNSGFDVQGAMKAGYSSQEIVQGLAKSAPQAARPAALPDFSAGNRLVESNAAPVASAPDFSARDKLIGGPLPDFSAGDKLVDPHAAGGPLPDFSAGNRLIDGSAANTSTSPLAALRNSAGSIVSGAGNLGQAVDQGLQRNVPAWLSKALGATGDLQTGADQAVIAAGQKLAGHQQYDGQSVHRFMTDAGNGNLGGAAYDALGGLASAAPMAATALVPGAGPAILGASGAGNTLAARMQAQGETSASPADIAAAAGSAALNTGLGPASAGVMKFLGPLGGNVASRLLLRTALSGGAGAATGAGNYALNAVGTGNMTGADALDAAEEGAGTGLAAGAVAGAGKSVGDAVGTMRAAHAAGPNIRAYAAETGPWNSAYQQAAQALQEANPGLGPDDLRSAAYQRAQSMGATPPTFASLSPSAQRGLAQLGVLQMFQQRQGLRAADSGKSPSSIPPASVLQGVVGDITRNLTTTSGLLRQAGLINPDQAQTLNAAIAEAKRGNGNPGEGGQAAGYFDTLRDQVNALPIDPAYRNTVSMMLRMADEAEDTAGQVSTAGPLERNANLIGPAIGLMAGGLIAPHFGTGLGTEDIAGLGGLIGLAKHGMVKSALRGLDTMLGAQRSPLLQNQAAIESFAQSQGLTNPVAPGDLQDIQQQLQGLASVVPGGAAARARAARFGTSPDPTVTPGYAGRQPMAMLSRRPGQSPVGQPVTSPQPAPMTGPVAQVSALQQALQGTSTANDAALMKAFPVAGTTWQRAIANNTGLPLQAIQDHLQGMVDGGQLPADLHAAITAKDFLPVGQYGRLSDYFANMAGQPGGTGAGAQGPGGRVASPVDPNAAIRLAKYRAAVQTAHNVHSNIVTQNPDLAPIANLLAGVKTAEDRGRVLAHYLAGIGNPAEQARAGAILRPLTAFGWKPSSGSAQPASQTPEDSETALAGM